MVFDTQLICRVEIHTSLFFRIEVHAVVAGVAKVILLRLFLKAQLYRFIINLYGAMLFAVAHALKCLSKGAMEVLALSIKGNEAQALSCFLALSALHMIDPGGSSRHHEKHGPLTCR